MTDPIDLVNRSAYVRLYSAAIGCEGQVLAEGRVVWYQEAPTIGIEGPDGGQRAWSTRLRVEEVEPPPVAEPVVFDLPWRLTGLDGFSTTHGYTFSGGTFTGGGPHSPQALGVRMLSEYGRPASVELELCDDRGGRAVSLTPDWARQAAAALNAAAVKADADIQQWRDQLQRLRGELADAAHRNAVRKAGLDG